MAKILIVDDEPDTGTAFAMLFQQAGHDAKHSPNGKDALIQVMQNLPDVVLLDLMMPEMDGPSFLEVVRSYLRLQSLPVVVLTGLGDSPMIDRVQHLKVNAVLAKGKVSSDEIVKEVERAVGHAPG
jgi:chemosensory pili system protein ChpA (sensor histidine kinase/response regulator)